MSAGKNNNRRAVSVALEAGGYNSGGVVSYPGDGFHVHEDFDVDPQYQFDGSRAGTSAGSSMQQADAKQGRFCDVSLSHRVHPPGAAASTTNVPTIDRLLRAHGMLKTLVVGTSNTYTPFTDGTWESLFGEFYVGGQKYIYQGGYVYKWTHTVEGFGTPVWQFNLKATLPNRVADASPTVPAGLTSYPFQTIPSPKAAASTLTLSAAGGGGAFQGLARKSTVTSERTIDDRMAQATITTATQSGHAGWQLGKYTQMIECTVEATALAASYSSASALDPERCAEEGVLITASLGFNQGTSTQRYKFVTGATAQIREAKKDKAGSIRLWNLTIALPPSTDLLDDGLSVVFD